jgi:hypothetical protein
MAFTLSQLAAVEAALASGVTRVEIDGRVVQYQKLSDLVALYELMKSELGVETPSTARGRKWVPKTGTGL